MSAWVEHAIWWQVYPLGFVGAFPADQPPEAGQHRLRRLVDWLDYAIELGASGLQLGPIFASETHGYDTVDHFRIDPRLGDDGDFDTLVAQATAQTLANQLKYGSLPISFKVQSNNTITATLGATQLQAGLLAGLIGLILVVLYSVLQYRSLASITIASSGLAICTTQSRG